MKNIFVNRWTQYYIPVTLLLFIFISVSFEREVTNTDGGYDRLHGLPWGYVTGNIGCTGCYERYILPLIGDMFIFLLVVLLLFKALPLLGLELKTHWIASSIGLLISCFCLFLLFYAPDPQYYKWWNDVPYITVRSHFRW